MSDRKQTMTRREAEERLARGEHLALAGRHVTHKRDLPPHPSGAEGKPEDDELEAVVARTPDGKLTRAGMEHAIRSGGSVMHQGEVLTRVEDLPDEAELVRHDAQAKDALAKSYDDQIAQLQQQKAKLAQPASEPAQQPAPTRGPTAETAGPEDDEGEKHPEPSGRTQPRRR